MKKADEMVDLSLRAQEQMQAAYLAEQAAELSLKVAQNAVNHEFESRAWNAAKEGSRSLVVTDINPNIQCLESLGFEAQYLTRRTSFQEHVEQECVSLQRRIIDSADNLLRDHSGELHISGDDFLHRNPLISYFETRIAKGLVMDMAHITLRRSSLGLIEKHVEDWWKARSTEFKQLFEAFERLARLREKRDEVKLLNQLIPNRHDSATWVSWAHAKRGFKIEYEFNASTLVWMADLWHPLLDYISEEVEHEAARGKLAITFLVIYKDSDWGDWGICLPDDDVNFEDTQACCEPSMLARELLELGYRCVVTESNLKPDASGGTEFTPVSHQIKLQIAWRN